MLFQYYLGLTLLTVLFLLILMRREGGVKPIVIWVIGGILPLMTAVCVGFAAQDKARTTLEHYLPTRTIVILTNGEKEDVVSLPPDTSACVARILRNQGEGYLPTDVHDIPLNKDTQVHGFLPESKFVQAQAILGKLNCKKMSGLLIQ